MDFAPYQDHSPETTRALSPPPDPQSRRSASYSPVPHNNNNNNNPPSKASPPPPNPTAYNHHNNFATTLYNRTPISPPEEGGDLISTATLGVRVEAVLAYLLFPPAGGVLLLLVEHRSDYVRFHAWQSALVFSVLFVCRVCFLGCVVFFFFAAFPGGGGRGGEDYKLIG